jgi:hypothetical protein
MNEITDLYHVCEEKPEYKAYGVYARSKSAAPTQPFRLESISFSHGAAKTYGERLQMQDPEKHRSIQGAPTSAQLPDTYSA